MIISKKYLNFEKLDKLPHQLSPFGGGWGRFFNSCLNHETSNKKYGK
jgi:hypothetical protein